MSAPSFCPTTQQKEIAAHSGSAFVTACPGAGKTSVLAERARRVFATVPPGRGVAFLSFTRAAVGELSSRLRCDAILPSPVFPSFVGTSDGFVWQFLIAPFGLAGTTARPRQIVEAGKLLVRPFASARPLPLSCFDPTTRKILPKLAKGLGFDVLSQTRARVQAYETAAERMLSTLRKRGYISYDQGRREALERIAHPTLSARIGAALSARFQEATVDEAQDCNPEDLEVVGWLRNAGIAVTLVCDPQQSIYGFRGGVTDQLVSFAEHFECHERKTLSGNFRSTPSICNAISQLRPPCDRLRSDEPLGVLSRDFTPIYVLSYTGQGVSPGIGKGFHAITTHAEA